VVKFELSYSKLRKQPFFAENFKIQGGHWPPLPPLGRPWCGFIRIPPWRHSRTISGMRHAYSSFGTHQPLIYVKTLIMLMLFSEQVRGWPKWSLRATWCPRAPCWWALI